MSLLKVDSSTTTPLSKSRMTTVYLSEGETITEETYQDTVIDAHLMQQLPPQKLATILRSRNGRDRSVLSK